MHYTSSSTVTSFTILLDAFIVFLLVDSAAIVESTRNSFLDASSLKIFVCVVTKPSSLTVTPCEVLFPVSL
jgi:hypothetical protein